MGILDFLFGPSVAQISVKEAHQRLRNKDVVMVDVRQPVELEAGVAPGAVSIPLTEFGRRFDELPRDKQILTICRSSHRSPMAAKKLAKAGYDVTDVAGGMIAWEQAGLPTSQPK